MATQRELFTQNTTSAPAASYVKALEVPSASKLSTARGAVFTKPEVADFILDLVGYTEDQPLYTKRLLEPSFGGGSFLLPAIRRLLRSWKTSGYKETPIKETPIDALKNTIRAVELHHETIHETREHVIHLLCQEGLDVASASALSRHWLIQGDFLLSPLEGRFDFVVGNPPYIRQEMLSPSLLAEYRARYRTMYDRADIYIPFIERSLLLLNHGGELGFICADRWMKNRYGGPLRELVARLFHLKIFVDMTDTLAFQSDVTTYPAITVISREKTSTTRIAHRPAIDSTSLAALSKALRAAELPKAGSNILELPDIINGSAPWILEPKNQIALIRRLEQNFSSMETAGCKVGIGVATGADKAYIGEYASMDVEDDRKLPLVMTKDIVSGEILWRGKGVINPFTNSGSLVDLQDYPRLRTYLESQRSIIENRHCARKNPANWYRTIDRITPSLATTPKLLIPDIKGSAHIVFDKGEFYPHHNLYYIVSEDWDLRALQAVLMSSVTHLFMTTYSTKMRGDFLRFQAQYLRRIRLPRWCDVPATLREELTEAAASRDTATCNSAVFKLYGLSAEERAFLMDSEGYIAVANATWCIANA